MLIVIGFGAVSDFAISKRQQTAEAVVVGHHPDDHNLYDLRIVVGGRQYTGRDTPLSGTIYVNQKVHIFFDPQAPQNMSLISFSDVGEHDLAPVPLLVLGVVGILGFALNQRKAKSGALPGVRSGDEDAPEIDLKVKG